MNPPARMDDLAGLQSLLAEHLPWSPRDFVEGISRRGDRALYAEQLTTPIAAADDLRFVHHLPDGQQLALFAQCLPWDSEFFGYGVARLNGIFPMAEPWHSPKSDYRPAVEELLRLAAARDVQYLFATVDPRDLATIRALGEAGFTLLETRFFHYGRITAPDLEQRLPVRQALESDIPSLARAARETINPFDRFHADPFIDPDAVGRLMEAWVVESVEGRMADVVIVPDVPEPEAFVTYRYHREHWARWRLRLVQGVLSAVSSRFAGWMGKLGPEVDHHLLGIGAETAFGSTQVTNRPIIFFAQEGGARFGRCEHVFRKLI